MRLHDISAKGGLGRVDAAGPPPRAVLGRFGALAKDHRPVAPRTDLDLDVLGPDRYHEVLASSPVLTDEDLGDLDRQASHCVVATATDRIVGSVWMTWGDVRVRGLGRTIEVLPGQHLAAHAYVDPEFRGRSLLSHLLDHFARRQRPFDEIWGLVRHDDLLTLSSVDRCGWTWSGDYWTRTVGGRTFGGVRRFGARSALSAARP